MSKFFTRFWNDAVWSKVVAGVFLAAAPAVYNWRSAIAEMAAPTWAFLTSASRVPNWVIIIAGLILLGLFSMAAFAGIVSLSRGKNQALAKDYVTDNFFGLVWRWKYYSDGGIHELAAFCPTCDYQVYAQDSSPFSFRVVFNCDVCNRTIGRFDERSGELEDKINRLIQQRIRIASGQSQVSQSR